MDNAPVQVLLIEDSPTATTLVRSLLAECAPPFVLQCTDRLTSGLERLAAGGIDVVLLDLALPESQGLDTLLCFRQRAADVPVVVLTGTDNEALALSAVQEGAQDYLVKDKVDQQTLVRSLRYAIERTRRQQAEAILRASKAEFQVARGQLEQQIHRQNQELRRKNEELLEQNRSVREVNRVKSEFLANMSHELRTPLNGIIGFAELMHDGKVGPVGALHKEYLGDILTSARHLLELINDILDLAKVESGKMEFRPEPVDLCKVVGEIRDILRTVAAGKRIPVDIRIAQALDRIVLDPAKLKQVLYNYLSNALKFTPEEGRVSIRVEPEDATSFRLEVADTGIGVRPEDLSRLFVEFQQLDAGPGRKYAGTGLGLALTKRIVEAQGGRVGVSSTPGRGSVFFAVLPCVAQTTTVAPFLEGKGLPPQPGAGAPTLLVIEDNPEEQAWLKGMLGQAGYAVETAASGAEAVAKCRRQAFNAITLDLLLPDMSSRDLVQAIQEQGANADVPVIVVTVVAERGAVAGFNIHDFLVKPIQGDELLASLRRAGVVPDGTRKILVVDDDPNALKVMGATLQHLGYQPICRADGAGGLRAAQEEPPAAVVLDLLMPGMDGFEFLERFRQSAAGHRVPVIIWTVKELAGEDRERLRRMAQGLVLKNQDGIASLLQELQLHLGARQPSIDG